jgi:hypothetical protein
MMKTIKNSLIIFFTLTPFVIYAQIRNPLNSEYSTLPTFLNALLDLIIIIATPIIVVMIVLAGFKFVTAGGNQEQLKSAKKTIVWTLVGALIILGAKAISAGIEETVNEITAMINIWIG